MLAARRHGGDATARALCSTGGASTAAVVRSARRALVTRCLGRPAQAALCQGHRCCVAIVIRQGEEGGPTCGGKVVGGVRGRPGTAARAGVRHRGAALGRGRGAAAVRACACTEQQPAAGRAWRARQRRKEGVRAGPRGRGGRERRKERGKEKKKRKRKMGERKEKDWRERGASARRRDSQRPLRPGRPRATLRGRADEATGKRSGSGIRR